MIHDPPNGHSKLTKINRSWFNVSRNRDIIRRNSRLLLYPENALYCRTSAILVVKTKAMNDLRGTHSARKSSTCDTVLPRPSNYIRWINLTIGSRWPTFRGRRPLQQASPPSFVLLFPPFPRVPLFLIIGVGGVRASLHFRSCWPRAHPFKNSLKVARSIHEFSTEERACRGDNLSRFLSAVFAPLFRDWIFIYNKEAIVVLVESFHRDRC